MACMQQTRASCESDYSEKEKTVSKGSQGCYSSEKVKHNHKSNAYSSQAGSQVAGAVACNPASANNHHNEGGYHKLTEKVTGLFGSNKNHQGSGCGSHGHQAVAHGSHQVVAHGNHGHQAVNHDTYGHQGVANGNHGHKAVNYDTNGHQATAHASHGHNGSGCNGSSHSHSHSHSHHKTISQEKYFEEKKEYTSCKEGGKKKVEKKVKKKSSYKCNSSDSESEKEYC